MLLKRVNNIVFAHPTVPVIAIDGPSASGKGTVARRIADEYGWVYFDSGLLYRAVGMIILTNQVDLSHLDRVNWATIVAQLNPVVMAHPDLKLESVGQLASRVAAVEALRTQLMYFQCNLLSKLSSDQFLVMDGRDIGTVIFPDAWLKFYITASVGVRAQRRHSEMKKRGVHHTLEEVAKDLEARDFRDLSRQSAPLKLAHDALLIDTSHLTAQEVFQRLCYFIDAKLKKAFA